jgi:hypothetical protein
MLDYIHSFKPQWTPSLPHIPASYKKVTALALGILAVVSLVYNFSLSRQVNTLGKQVKDLDPKYRFSSEKFQLVDVLFAEKHQTHIDAKCVVIIPSINELKDTLHKALLRAGMDEESADLVYKETDYTGGFQIWKRADRDEHVFMIVPDIEQLGRINHLECGTVFLPRVGLDRPTMIWYDNIITELKGLKEKPALEFVLNYDLQNEESFEQLVAAIKKSLQSDP